MEERSRERQPLPVEVIPEPEPVQQAVDETRNRVAPGERSLAEAFVRQFAAAPGADAIEEKELTALAMAAFRFLTDRNPEEPRIRVFQPDIAHEGWSASGTAIQIALRYRPFVENTVRLCLEEMECNVQRLFVATFAVERDPRRIVLAIGPPGPIGSKEMLLHVEIDRMPEPQVLASLIARRLSDLILATDDYQPMQARLEAAVDDLRARNLAPPWKQEAEEAAAFLAWLGDHHFIFLGYREYQFDGQGPDRTASVKRGSGLGILQSEDQSGFATPTRLTDVQRRRIIEPPLLMITKTNGESTVQRRAHMDYIGVKEIDNSGVVVGERRWLGLFTAAALATDPTSIPLLNSKLERVLALEGVPRDSDGAAAITRSFKSLPKSDALSMSAGELRSELRAIRAAGRGGDVQVSYRPDYLERGTFALVTLPPERFAPGLFASTEQRLLRTTGASSVFDRNLITIEGEPVRMHFYLNVPPEMVRTVPQRDLEAPVLSGLRTWEDRLRDELGRQYDKHQAADLVERYLGVFPADYQRDVDVREVVRDIQFLEELRGDRLPRADVAAEADSGAGRYGTVKVYCQDQQLVLGELVASLGNLGLSVLSVRTARLPITGVGEVEVHSFRVQDAEGAVLDTRRVAPLLREVLTRLQRGRLRDDRLNTLISRAHLGWREVELLRLYVNYAVQLHDVASRDGVENALLRHPQSARLLWEYFAAKFDPLESASARDRLSRALPEVEQRFVASLQSGHGANEARLLRLLFGIIRATVRTNFFRASASGAALEDGAGEATPLAIKIESSRIPEVGGARPRWELFVDGFGVQGLYARAGRVARGGIFFVDAADQLRQRVLERLRLLSLRTGATAADAAQGAFTVHRDGRTPISLVQVQQGYRTFLATVLGLTDNIEQGRVTPPQGTVLYDEPDAYLHVSDNATPDAYSDIARSVAAESGFWVDEAIAAGGARGGGAEIIARNAWTAVRRHFHELGIDADRETMTLVGIGRLDDSAFARGLLLSRRFHLRAAFDEHWILLDPDPDLARSYVERERLVAMPNSSWAHYDRNVISEGGALFARDAPRVELHPIARGLLGIDRETASGDEIVRAILRLPVDLMWCGDAGIYVKAPDENDAEIGDSANDAVRIGATSLHCRVVAEIGPALTQRGRVTFATAGGHLNSAAVDGNAGIVLADRDSNCRLAVAAAGEGGGLTVHEQKRVLVDAAADIATEVMADGHHRVVAIHRDLLRSQSHIDEFFEVMARLETDRVLDRRSEQLPDRETVRHRRAQFNGLTRPELAVLGNATRTWLRHQLLATSLPDDGFCERYLRDYFPQLINDRCGQGVRSHRLRRDIIAAEMANALVDMMGVTFVTRLSAEAGVDPVVVIRAWVVVSQLATADRLWREIVDADPALPLGAENSCWDVLVQAIERATRWMVFTQPHEVAATVLAETFMAPTRELLNNLPALQPSATQQKIIAMVERIANQGVPRALPQQLVPLLRLVELLDIVQISIERGRDHALVAEAYYRLDDLLELDWIEQRLVEQPGDDAWAQRALEALREELISVRRQLTEQVLMNRPEAATVEEGLGDYLVANEPRLRRIGDLMDNLTTTPHVTLAGLLVIVRELRRLSEDRGQ